MEEETGCAVFQQSQPECTILSDSVIITQCSKSTDEQVKCSIKPEEKCSHVKENASMEVTVSGVECQAFSHKPNPPNIADIHTVNKLCTQERNNLDNKNSQSSLVITESSEMHRKLGQQNHLEISVHTHNLQIQPMDLTPSNCKTNELIHLAQKQDMPIQSPIHKQTMQAQSSIVSTQVQQHCVQMITSVPAHVSGHCRVVEAPCYSPCHHAVVKDTFAAFCHPQPIPAPAQLIPRPPSIEGEYMGQKIGPACLALPPLISSISETRLDSKRLMQRCSLDCNWPGALCQTRNQLQAAKQEITKDVGTMTSCKELRDMGVQVSQTDTERLSQHVFPEVCLADEMYTGSTKSSTQKKTKVTEVKWDAEGMTWEVYGASVDPEELGLAIQKHLELQIKETADKAVNISQQNTITKKPDKDKSQRKKCRVFAALRHPSVCCTRSSAVLD